MWKVVVELHAKLMPASMVENVWITTMCTPVIAARLHFMVTSVMKVGYTHDNYHTALLTGLVRFPRSQLTTKSFVNYQYVHMSGRAGLVVEIPVFPTGIVVTGLEIFPI